MEGFSTEILTLLGFSDSSFFLTLLHTPLSLALELNLHQRGGRYRPNYNRRNKAGTAARGGTREEWAGGGAGWLWEWQGRGLWASTLNPFAPELVTLSHLPPTSPAAAGPQDPRSGRGKKGAGRQAESSPLSLPSGLLQPPSPPPPAPSPVLRRAGRAGQGWGAAQRRSHRLGCPL